LAFNTAIGTNSGDAGTLEVASGGIMTFVAAVGIGQTLVFEDTAGLVKLADAVQFAAAISGFVVGDTIDLAAATVTGLQFSSRDLTVNGSTGTLATLVFAGDYTRSEFTCSPDGSGGADLKLAPLPTVVTQSYLTNENAALSEPAPDGLLAGASGNALATNLAAAAAHGSVTVNADGSFTYTPDATYYRSDSLPTLLPTARAPGPVSRRQ
jgi:hypothetical protein